MAKAYAIFTKIIFGIVIIIAIILLLKKEFIAAIVSLLAGFLYLFPALAIADLSDQNEILRLNIYGTNKPNGIKHAIFPNRFKTAL